VPSRAVARRSAKKATGLPATPRPKAPPPVRSTGGSAPIDRRRLALYGGIAAAVIAAIVLAVVLTRGGSSASAPPKAIPWSQLGQLQNGPPPWNNGLGGLTDRLSLLNLNALGSEGTVLHIHQHLDLYVNGNKVPIPA